MGRPLAAPAAAAAAAFLLALAAGLLAAAEPSPHSSSAARAHGGSRPVAPALPREPPSRENPAPLGSAAWPRGNASGAQALLAAAAKGPQLSPPDGPPGRSGQDVAGTLPSVRFFPGEAEEKKEAPGELWTGPSEAKGPMEAQSVVGSFAPPAPEQDEARSLLEQKEESPFLGPESQEEVGSGDQHAKASPDPAAATQSSVPPTHTFAGGTSVVAGLPPSSADVGLPLDPRDAGALPSPTLGSPVQTPELLGRPGEQDSAQKQEPVELWVASSSSSPVEGVQGHTDLTWLEAGTPQAAITPPVKAAETVKPSADPLASEIIDIDYYDLFDGDGLGGAGPDSTKRKAAEDRGMSWSLHDIYDDFTPFEESDFYPTTSFYTDGDEEDLEDLEEEEEEEEEEDGAGGPGRELEDENDSRVPTPITPKTQATGQEAEATSRRYGVPPLQTFVVSVGNGAATLKPRPAEAGRDLTLSGGSAAATAAGDNGTECRSGYVRHNNSCRSVCDSFPSYCHNGGQCYLVENLGAFCRCNTQDYIWHKGIRCESIITDFQVMCVAVGSAALVVLLLFMMTVFFAKKLYLLKTENSKLRKTKYRTPSELHNDNFSLSTIAEGSHPNDDPNAPHKLQDPLKSCLKEEESFNIQNSLSSKLDNGKGEADDREVNCLQNNLT